jgi:hypothetical protein
MKFIIQWSSYHIVYNFIQQTKNVKFWEELIAYFPLIRQKSHRKWRIQQFFYCCVSILCRGNVFIQPLPSNNRRIYIYIYIYIYICRLMGGFMMYVILMVSGAIIKICSGIIKLIEVNTQTHRQHGSRKAYFYFVKIRKAGSWIKINK